MLKIEEDISDNMDLVNETKISQNKKKFKTKWKSEQENIF